MSSTRKDLFAFLGLLGLLLIFFPELATVTSAPLTGDHLDQHYPWAYLLATSVKSFHLPFWTRAIQSGFPIAAEGQIGVFYIPNLIFFFFLPFKTAYSYLNLFHWLLAGWGTYIYSKRIKMDPFPAFVAAIIFVLGAAYGGAYYNMTSLKTIAWFPLGLWILERIIAHIRWKDLLALALLISQSLIAGYLQVAILTWMVFSIYAVLRIFFIKDEPFRWPQQSLLMGALFLTALLTLIFAAPQIYLTFQIAMQSNRIGLAEGYAYVGSLSPLALGTLIHPYLSLILRGNNLYMGLLPIFFTLVAFFSPEARKNHWLRIWIAMIVIVLLLALGRWSPLYIALIKLTKFYAFRIPAKFIVFVCFGSAIVAGFGFQQIWNGVATQTVIKKSAQVYFWILGLFLGVMTFFGFVLTWGRNLLLQAGEYYIRHFVYGQPGHPHSLESYLAGVRAYPDALLPYFSWHNPQNLLFFLLLALSGLLVFSISWKAPSRRLLILGIVFTLIDFYALSYIDIRLDFLPYRAVLKPSPILQELEKAKAAGKPVKIYGFRALGERLPLVPSQNMLVGVDDVGGYSPFIFSRYFQTIGLLGNVNDSNFQSSPTAEYLIERLNLLSFLNISHVLSAHPLSASSLRLLEREKQYEAFLYENQGERQPAYFIENVEVLESWDDLKEKLMAPGFDPRTTLLLEESEIAKAAYSKSSNPGSLSTTITLVRRTDHFEEWKVETNRPGFLVVPETYFEGWCAQLDGAGAPILRANGLFRALQVKTPGKHRISFEYHPFAKSKL